MQVTFNEQDVKNPEVREMLLTLLGASLPTPRVIGEVVVNVDTKQATADVEKLRDAAAETVRVLNHAAEVGQSLAAAPAQPAPGNEVHTPAATAGSDMFDKDGYPWDARIHSETRNKNQDGTWRVRRGVDKDLLEAVRAEFKNGGANAAELLEDVKAAPAAPVTAAPAPAQPAPAFGGELPEGAKPVEPAPAAPAPSAPPPAATAQPADEDNAWPAAILGTPSSEKGEVQLFMEYAMLLIQDGKIQAPDILSIANTEGLKTLVAVGTFPEKIPVLVRKIQAHLLARRA